MDTCPKCGKQFAATKLSGHIMRCAVQKPVPARRIPAICPVCKRKVFGLVEHLSTHIELSAPPRVRHRFLGRTQKVWNAGKFPFSVQERSRSEERDFELRIPDTSMVGVQGKHPQTGEAIKIKAKPKAKLHIAKAVKDAIAPVNAPAKK